MNHSYASYREYHENYISNHSGGGLLDVPLVLTPVAFVGFIAIYVRCLFPYRNHVLCFLLDFVVIVLPSTLFLTILSDHLVECLVASSLLSFSIIVRELFFRQNDLTVSEALNIKISIKRRPFVTNFKAIVSLLSVICILAVDFIVFPKRFIKTETYGFSLMDTGVGFFVVANALTCDVKGLKGLNTLAQSMKEFMSNVPILVLGMIRYVTTEKINYQKHVTEYGVHWNFFFTLAIVKFLGPKIARKFPPKWYLYIIWFAAHECVLTLGLESWIMNNSPRTDIISSNKEGIVSLIGYLCLYAVGAHMGAWLLYTNPKSPGRRPLGNSLKEELKKGFQCIGLFLIMTIYLHFTTFHPSRRLANPTFVIWITSICFFVLGVSIVWESLISVFCRRMNCGAHCTSTTFILEAICTNNLAFFLLGNLLTGAVNISMKTLFVPSHFALLIVVMYVAASTGIISLFHSKKVTLKYW